MEHVIKKQIIEMRLNKAADAFVMQQKMSNYYHVVILPLLDKIFSELTADNDIIQIDSLQLDLGFMSIKDLESHVLSPDIYQKLLEQIRSFVSESKRVQRDALATQFLKSAASQWIYYMQHGFLPWNTVKVSAAWYDQVLEMFATDFESVTILRKLLLTDAAAITRVIAQHPDDFLVRLMEILTSQNQEKLKQGLIEIEKIWGHLFEFENGYVVQKNKQFSRKIWQYILKLSALGETALTTDILFEKMVYSFLKSEEESRFVWNKVGSELKITSAVFQKIAKEKGFKIEVTKNEKINFQKSELEQKVKKGNELKQTIKRIEIENRESKNIDPNKEAPVDDSVFISDHTKLSKNKNPLESNKKHFKTTKVNTDKLTNQDAEINLSAEKRSENFEIKLSHSEIIPSSNIRNQPVKTVEEILETDGIFVQFAGVVLLHPFLSHFFKIIKLVENGQFVNTALHQKALYLIHYLATGRTEAEEYELLIPKILCAYPLDESVEKDIQLREEEITEANELLKVAISHWEILKSTSPGGLREGFLQRNGKLYSDKGKLHIQVEASSIDMLLDYLPWNLSIIKLPWMNEVLRVKWR